MTQQVMPAGIQVTRSPWRGTGSTPEGFVTASGKICGERILPRDIFWRRMLPLGPPSGKVIVISPAFMETGRDWEGVTFKLAQDGHDVIVMDHAWAGYSEGETGQIDRGLGVARDVAAVAAMAHQVLKRTYPEHPAGEVVLLGAGLGASAGVLTALVAQAASAISLDGLPMPSGLRGILSGPTLDLTEAATPNLLTSLLSLERFVRLRTDAGEGAQTRITRQVWKAVKQDLDLTWNLVESARPNLGRISLFHAHQDSIASAEATRRWAEHLGPSAHFRLLHSVQHNLHVVPEEFAYVCLALSNG